MSKPNDVTGAKNWPTEAESTTHQTSKTSAVPDSQTTTGSVTGEPDEPLRAHGAPVDRETKVREAAYAAAERRGFAPGQEIEDWLEAERAVDAENARAASDESSAMDGS